MRMYKPGDKVELLDDEGQALAVTWVQEDGSIIFPPFYNDGLHVTKIFVVDEPAE